MQHRVDAPNLVMQTRETVGASPICQSLMLAAAECLVSIGWKGRGLRGLEFHPESLAIFPSLGLDAGESCAFLLGLDYTDCHAVNI